MLSQWGLEYCSILNSFPITMQSRGKLYEEVKIMVKRMSMEKSSLNHDAKLSCDNVFYIIVKK